MQIDLYNFKNTQPKIIQILQIFTNCSLRTWLPVGIGRNLITIVTVFTNLENCRICNFVPDVSDVLHIYKLICNLVPTQFPWKRISQVRICKVCSFGLDF